MKAAKDSGVPAVQIGVSGSGELKVEGLFTISVESLAQAHQGWMPGYMSSSPTG